MQTSAISRFYRSFSARFPVCLALLFIITGGLVQTSHSQQMVVDDAGVTGYRTFQLESWLGTEESWILPAFSPIRNLEVGAGIVFSDNETFFVSEAKYMFRDPEKHVPGFALVTGAFLAPFEEFYAFVPVTLPLVNDRVMLHGNLGYQFERHEEPHGVHEHLEDDHLLTWGARADINLYGPFWILGELFGANDFTPDFQTGVRTEVIPESLEMDVTYGNNFSRDHSGMGFTFGFAWNTSPLW